MTRPWSTGMAIMAAPANRIRAGVLRAPRSGDGCLIKEGFARLGVAAKRLRLLRRLLPLAQEAFEFLRQLVSGRERPGIKAQLVVWALIFESLNEGLQSLVV